LDAIWELPVSGTLAPSFHHRGKRKTIRVSSASL
jgi:hypothetical protein